MDIGSLLIVVAVAILAGAFVARPLFDGRSFSESVQDPRLAGIQAELDRVLAMIQELDMDFAMEKVDAEDHRSQRAALTARGAELLRRRDELQGGPAGALSADPREALIESEVARLRGRAAPAAGFCGSCGQPAMAGDRFCVRCGAPLVAEARA